MTSKIVVNNIEADSGINTITFINEVTAPTFNGNIVGTAATFTTGTFSGNVDIAGALTYEDVTNVDSVGIVTARSGIHVTGGSVGIGTDNPETKLNIVGSTASASSSGGTLGIRQKGDTNNDGITLTSSHANSARFWKDSDGKLHIYNTGTGSDQFVLDNAGSTGIGTDNPSVKLHVHGGKIRATNTAKTNFTELGMDGNIEIKRDSGGAYIDFADDTTEDYDVRIQEESNGLRFITGGSGSTSERLRIDSSGCVRVGNTHSQTTSSNTKRIALGAKGSIWGWTSGNINGALTLADNYYWDGANNRAIEADDAAYLSLRSGSLRFGTTDSTPSAGGVTGLTEKFRITSDGKLGHGTATPSSAFHGTVSSGGYNAIFETTTNGGEAVVTLKGKKSDGTVRSAVFKYDNADMIRLGTSQAIPMRFETNDTERIHITSAGEIGINANSNWTNGTTLLVQGNTGASIKSMITVRGGSSGYVHSAIKLSATSDSNSGGNYRGLGVFMHDEASNVEWYAGRPYSQSDYFLIARNTSVSAANSGGVTAQLSKKMWQVDSSGRTVQNGAIHTYQPGIGGGKTTRAFEAKGGAGTYSTCQIDVSQHSYGSVSYDIMVAGYHSAHQHVVGSYYCNGGLYANYTSIDNDGGNNITYTRAFTSNQTIRHTFTYNNGFVHPICKVTATCGGDGYLGPGDITITWS